MSSSAPILVTGSAGRIGRAVVTELLAQNLPVRPFDRRPTPGCGDAGGWNLQDESQVEAAMAGCGALLHLAATPEDDDFARCLLPDNLVGLHTVLTAAARHRVPRVVLASSIQINLRQSRSGPWPVRVTDAPSPLRWYAATKAFLESAGYSHAADYGVSVLAVRLGWCPRTAAQVAEIEAEPLAQDTYLSPGDAGRCLHRAVTVPLPPGFQVMFATSRPRTRWIFDPTPAMRGLGWEPLDEWPVGALPSPS
jgi:uronate dehydrogenase